MTFFQNVIRSKVDSGIMYAKTYRRDLDACIGMDDGTAVRFVVDGATRALETGKLNRYSLSNDESQILFNTAVMGKWFLKRRTAENGLPWKA